MFGEEQLKNTCGYWDWSKHIGFVVCVSNIYYGISLIVVIKNAVKAQFDLAREWVCHTFEETDLLKS